MRLRGAQVTDMAILVAGCRPERSSQSAKTGSSCCARSGGPRRSRRSGDGVDADVRVGLEQRGQAGDDLGGEEFAAQVRAGLLGGLEAVEDLDVLLTRASFGDVAS